MTFMKIEETSRKEEQCEGDGCDDESCQLCCDHEYDPDEGMMCILCDAEYPY